jgi:serine phosphatase RsbU (regulator of sigma subunit)
MWSKLSIKAQLIIFMILLVSIVQVSTLLIIYNLQKNESRSDAILEVDTITRSLNNDLLKVILNPSADMLSDVTFRLSAFQNINALILFDNENNSIYKFGEDKKVYSRKKEILEKKILFTKDNLFIKKELKADGYTLGYTLLEVDITPYEIHQLNIRNTILFILLIALIVGFVLSLFLSRSYTKPFALLVDAMRKSDPTKNKIVELQTQANNEIKELFCGFNDLMNQVYKSTLDIYLKAEHDKLKEIHKHTKESIEYASLIQEALIPDIDLINQHFKDSFIHWEPKDTVGGDIYLFDGLRNKNECLLMCIDCTGHGVPGAFVTMLVKAVEAQVLLEIRNSPDLDISPSWIMGYFNRTIKTLLKQEEKSSNSNAGFDGGIIYYNKEKSVIKFCGAQTPLFYVDNDGKLTTIKGDRYSVGYKKCDMNYVYKESTIQVEEGMRFYCTTDGYLDQNGGEKDFPFGKKRFTKIITENYTKPMEEQKQIFLKNMKEYENMQSQSDRNDDITVVGFKI